MTREEFNKCADAFSDDVFRFVKKTAGKGLTAEDIVQDCFEKLWIRHDNIDFQKAKPYLFTCAYNSVMDFFRRKKIVYTEVTELGQNLIQDSYRQYNGLKETLEEALKKLPADQKCVIILRDYEGYSYEEIAKITGLSLAAVKVYIFRGRVAMKKHLELAGITAENF